VKRNDRPWANRQRRFGANYPIFDLQRHSHKQGDSEQLTPLSAADSLR